MVTIIPIENLQGHIYPSALAGLNAYLGNVKVGFDEQLTTPFAQGNPREQADKLFTTIAQSGIPELDELESDEVERFGPYSVRLPWEERREGVLEYFQPRRASDTRQLIFNRDRIARLIKPHSLFPLSMEASFDQMPKDSNLGLPVFSSDKRFLELYLKLANQLKSGGFSDVLLPAILGWRGQASGDPSFPKQRVVWMESHLETIVGLSIQIPLLERLKHLPVFAAWNDLMVVDKTITKFIDGVRAGIMSADFHGFDKRATVEAIHETFNLFRIWFAKPAERQIDWLEESFLRVGLVTPDGIYTGREGAVPSGSALTNLVDCFVQMLMVIDMVDQVTVLGDDGVYNGVSNPDEITENLLNRYGAEISADKGGYGTDQVFYLQRLHLRGYRKHGLCVGIRSLVRSFNSICHLERFTPDLHPAFFSARALSIIENSKNHPRFFHGVKWLYQNDELMRKFDPVELFSLAGGAKFVEKKLGLDGFKFGRELPSVGLNDFESVKILRSLKSRTNRKAA